MAKSNSLRSIAQKLSIAKQRLKVFEEQTKGQVDMFNNSEMLTYLKAVVESDQKQYDEAKKRIDDNPEQYKLYLKLKGIYG